MKEQKLNIERFLGLHSDGMGDTQLLKGELSSMQNFKIVEDYKLEKRTGYEAILSIDIENVMPNSDFGS